MTREEWSRLRTSNNLPVSVLFEYYREVGGILDDLLTFKQMFSSAINNPLRTGLKSVDWQTATRRTKEYYDNKFDVK